jgi:TolA-binding protein
LLGAGASAQAGGGNAGNAGSSYGGPGAAAAPVAGSSPGSGSAGPGDAGGEQAAYSRAFDALKGNDYNSAITRFKDFLRQYPQSTLAGNAQYWLGESYYVTQLPRGGRSISEVVQGA